MKRYILGLILSSALFISLNSCKKDDTSVNNGDTNNPPTVPVNPVPADSTTGIDDSTDVQLSWESTEPDLNDTLKFDVFVGTSLPLSEVPLAANLTSPSYNIGMLPFPGTTYFWQIKAKDNHGASSTGNVWRFTIRTRP
ncbi:MAG TPA: hypothetical protein VG961_13900 [Ignavibacteria bacterium]|nr:hypothetical protein [Ignavibacteria bacterium]